MTEVIAIFQRVFFQNKTLILLFVRWGLAISLILFQTAQAIDNLSFNVERIEMNDWRIEDVGFSLSEIQNPSQQISLSIKKIVLPKPLSDISFSEIKCQSFSWNNNKITCSQGSATLQSDLVSSSNASFSFILAEKHSYFSIKNLQFAQGKISLQANEKEGYWHITLNSKNQNLNSIHTSFSGNTDFVKDITTGSVSTEIQLKGSQEAIDSLIIGSQFKDVSLIANQKDLQFSMLDFDVDLNVEKQDQNWFWENTIHIKQGELYSKPIYLAINDKDLFMNNEGLWSEQAGVEIHYAKFNHHDVVNLDLGGLIKLSPELKAETAQIFVNVLDVGLFSRQYIFPFFKTTETENIKIKGQMEAAISISESIIQKVSGTITQISVKDNKQRVMVDNAGAKINWSPSSSFQTPSSLTWDKMVIMSIPFEANRLDFLSRNKEIILLKPSSLNILGGVLDITKFSWLHENNDEPKVYFEGGVRNLSLEQLSQALNWTPLTGIISGNIPGVDYKNKTLTLKGELKVDVFDGTIKINHLASSGLFTNFSKFNMDMELDNLDLYAITKKFQTGEIEGRLSGSIKNLYLENWEPVTFYAWLGTPDGDNSNHRISQKAVENIASIGGGGAADVISKGFLRFFDTFGYDRLGFGCYLHQGVCQLMGVDATESGFYFIKGGGLPRIDVIGYHTQVDWKVLLERLSRISTTNEIVVE